MQKKIEQKLKRLAKRIVKQDKNIDLDLLKNEAQQLYERLCVLVYLKQNQKTKKHKRKSSEAYGSYDLFSIQDEIGVDANFEDIFVKKEGVETNFISMPFDKDASAEDEPKKVKKQIDVEIKKDAPKTKDTLESVNSKPEIKFSLNDKINKFIKVDLNDRIAFVKHLFEGNQEDFNRVLSQLNSFENEIDAKDFLLKQVKPDYSWEGKESYEERLLLLIERKFL